MEHMIDEYAGVIMGIIVTYSMLAIFINTYGETVIGICAIIIVMMLVGMSMAAYRNILLNVISSCLG